MTLAKPIFIGLSAFLLYSLVSKARAAGSLNFYPDKIADIDVDGFSPVITAFVRVQNTSNQSLVLRSIAGNVYTNGNLIGNISNFQSVQIPANAEALIPLYLRLSWLNVVNDIIKAFQGGSAKATIDVDTTVNIDGLPVTDVPMKFIVP